MRVGIVGFAGSGKTTIFNALTGLAADTGYGSKKDKANLGMIKVPDPRVELLAEVHHPKKTTFAEIAFVDVAGPASKSGEGGLEQRLVAEMRQVDALVHVVRGFDNPALTRKADPVRDLVDFEEEVILTDLIQVEGKLDRLRKEGKKTLERALIERLHAHLDAGKALRGMELNEQEVSSVSGFAFLSLKPCMALVNRGDAEAGAPLSPALAAAAEERGLSVMSMAGIAEAEIAQLPAEDQAAFLADLGLAESARARFIAAVYAQLDLISFLTAGPDECRAWTIRRGTTARKAAGKIHSDIERGFIRAEVIAFDDFAECRSEAKCRELGKLRLEGKEYVMQDGDITNFRFNV